MKCNKKQYRKGNYYSLGTTLLNLRDNLSNNEIIQKLGGIDTVSKGISVLSPLLGNALSGELESGAGNTLTSLGNIASTIPGPYGATVSFALNTLGGITNRLTGSSLNKEKINAINNEISTANAFTTNAGDYDSLFSTMQDVPSISSFSKSDIGKDGVFGNKANKMYKKLKKQASIAENWIDRSINNNADNIAFNTLSNLESNYFAKGGEKVTAINDLFNFTNVNEKALGGDIAPAFSNGITNINEGNTHENNPNGGVQLGVDNEGIPNLVEEGEVIYNNYVFSNRITLPKDLQKKYKIKGTYADAAKKAQKESKERPYDPISRKGLETVLLDLSNRQELQRQEIEMKNNTFAKGGVKGTIKDIISADDLSSFDFNRKEYNVTPLFEEADFRYAPVAMSGVSTLTDIFSKPDYKAAKQVEGVNINIPQVHTSPISQKLKYTPTDKQAFISPLMKNAAYSRNLAKNMSGGNRAAALNAIASVDANFINGLGNLTRQAEDYNMNLRQKVADFNRATDMFNSQQSMQAQNTNASFLDNATKLRLGQMESAAKMRQLARDSYNARRSNNLNMFVNNLGNLGWEAVNRNMINSNPALYYALSNLGNITYK